MRVLCWLIVKAPRVTAYPAPFPPYDDEAAPVRQWPLRLLLLGLLGTVLLSVILLAAIVAVQQTYRAAIVPGVRAAGLDLAGLTPGEAAAALETRFAYADSAVFTFRIPGDERTWTATARELGVRLDAAATAQAAFAIGRAGSTPDLPGLAAAWLTGHSVAPLIAYDQAAALDWLAGVAAQIDQPPQPAALALTETGVSVTPAVTGRFLDLPGTLAGLETALITLQPGGEIPLIVHEIVPPEAGITAAAERIRAAISTPLTLTAPAADGSALTWTIAPEQIAGLITIAPVTGADGTLTYQVSADVGAYRAELERLAPGLILPTQNGRFNFDAATGQLIPLRPAVHGRRLNVDGTLAALHAAIFNDGVTAPRTVPLVFDEERPAYFNGVTAAELGITELVAEGVSSYAGSSDARLTNIRIATAQFDGVIVAPGELFSFNNTLGPITPEAGYVQSAVIFGGRTILGDGGGVCQVSTTIFRAVFFGGYPIAERWAHGYRVGFYENGDPLGSGMDAAIYIGELDFKFINDTDYHILIDADVLEETAQVRFRFYSTNPGRVVEHDGPLMRDLVEPLPTRYEVNPNLQPGEVRQVDTAIQGAYVEVTRIIRDLNGNEIDREIIASQYQPWGAIFQVPPGDPRAGT